MEATFDHARCTATRHRLLRRRAEGARRPRRRRHRLRRRDRAAREGGRREVRRVVERTARYGHRGARGGQVSVTVVATGAAAEAVDRLVPQLVSDGVAGGITSQDPSLWGPDAEEESAKRLGWTEAVAISRRAGRRHPALRKSSRRRRRPHRPRRHGRIVARPRGHHPHLRRRADRARRDRPRTGARRPRRPAREDRRRDLVEVGLDGGDRQPEARLRGRSATPASTRPSASSWSPIPARRSTSRLAPTATASSTPTRTSEGGTRP